MYKWILFAITTFCSLSAAAGHNHEHDKGEGTKWAFIMGAHFSATSGVHELELEYALTLGVEIEIEFEGWDLIIVPEVEFGLGKTTLINGQWVVMLPFPALTLAATLDSGVFVELGVHTHYEAIEHPRKRRVHAFQTTTHLLAGWQNSFFSCGLGGAVWPVHHEEEGYIAYSIGPAAKVGFEWGWGGVHALGSLEILEGGIESTSGRVGVDVHF